MKNLDKYIEGKELFDGHYRLIKLLSEEGGTADVWLAENESSIDTTYSEADDDVVKIEGTGVLVAIKIYRPKNVLDVEGEQSFRQEFKTIFNCHHSNLVPTTDYSICEGLPYLVMPYCPKGSAEQLIGKLSQPKDIWQFLYDVASGLEYLHSCSPQIIHQDIKPANILIDNKGNYCISDFGICVNYGIRNQNYFDNLNSGTKQYMAPERFQDDYIPAPSGDIWALGITIYELITGNVPRFDEIENQTIFSHKNLSSDLSGLIKRCLSIDPQKRPSAHEIVELSRSKVYSKKSKQLLWPLVVVALVCICGFFLFARNSNRDYSSETKDFLEVFAEGIWVCDHPEVPIWEEWQVPMSGVVLYSYDYNHIRQKVVNSLRAIPVYTPEDSILLMECDTLVSVSGKITKYSKYEFVWKTENGPFTYNKVIGLICGNINDIVAFDASTYLPEEIMSYKVHNTAIVELSTDNEHITFLKEGRTYIEVESERGTALIQIDCLAK